jgi:hypothetical protein
MSGFLQNLSSVFGSLFLLLLTIKLLINKELQFIIKHQFIEANFQNFSLEVGEMHKLRWMDDVRYREVG